MQKGTGPVRPGLPDYKTWHVDGVDGEPATAHISAMDTPLDQSLLLDPLVRLQKHTKSCSDCLKGAERSI